MNTCLTKDLAVLEVWKVKYLWWWCVPVFPTPLGWPDYKSFTILHPQVICEVSLYFCKNNLMSAKEKLLNLLVLCWFMGLEHLQPQGNCKFWAKKKLNKIYITLHAFIGCCPGAAFNLSGLQINCWFENVEKEYTKHTVRNAEKIKCCFFISDRMFSIYPKNVYW